MLIEGPGLILLVAVVVVFALIGVFFCCALLVEDWWDNWLHLRAVMRREKRPRHNIKFSKLEQCAQDYCDRELKRPSGSN